MKLPKFITLTLWNDKKKMKKFQWVLFSDLFLSKLKPLLISRSKAKNQRNAGAASKKTLKQQNASF